jgi:hypothetical protein
MHSYSSVLLMKVIGTPLSFGHLPLKRGEPLQQDQGNFTYPPFQRRIMFLSFFLSRR